MMKLPFRIAAIAALISAQLFALEGKVVRVSDGDTIVVLDENKNQVRIRLIGIDAPESKQAFGKRSKENLASVCAGVTAIVNERGLDKYGRTLGIVYCNGINANEKQVEDGYAWSYMSNAYDSLEKAAREAKLGLWVDPNPQRPSDFRKANR